MTAYEDLSLYEPEKILDAASRTLDLSRPRPARRTRPHALTTPEAPASHVLAGASVLPPAL